MNTLSEIVKTTTVDFIQSVMIDKNKGYIDEMLAVNCVASNQYGFSLGNDAYATLVRKWWSSFEFIRYSDLDQNSYGNVTKVSLRYKIKHVGEYKSIKETGKVIDIAMTGKVAINESKISFLYSSINESDIIKKLAGEDSSEYSESLKTSPIVDCADNFFEMTLELMSSYGVTITNRELQCLCLWCAGRPVSDIADILGLTPKTVDCYQSRLRASFGCSKKHQIFERLAHLGLSAIMNQCLIYVLNNKAPVN